MVSVSQLTDEQAIRATNFIVQEWIKVAGSKVFEVSQTIEKVRQAQGPIEDWIVDPKSDDPKVAKLCRIMLEAFLDSPRGQGPDFGKWAKKAITDATQVHAQVFEPATLMLLIGLVLAARLKSIGPGGVKFYEGLPASLSKVLEVASSTSTIG
ncbi:hypothetical protein J4G43_026855 [Bradyrhizobium barranii subsp. barranii]|uniref:Uncharacterized protein n=1 Tax=Bradyrhizobium barranii subsp. barranii TaxID=2823807 RepID=A0A939M7V8_9BRAD|nr:hypothetical protein [Bradyrhizobium barranii]UEM08415.1 hypothetical protein J4G43_026855 [Bradyrhizobium barranii subsp. barranii]